MIKIIKRVVAIVVIAPIVLILASAGVYLLFLGSYSDMREDATLLQRWSRLRLFNANIVKELKGDDLEYLYKDKCYRRCHGESAMITVVLPPSGWVQILERMRMKENVNISGREVDAIVGFLEERYSSEKSKYSYKIRKKIHSAVWRADAGEDDIYLDVIYATDVYLKSIGADYLISEYDLNDYYVFIVTLTVHVGEIALSDLDTITTLRVGNDTLKTTPPWKLRFYTADKHHYEGVVRFAKNSSLNENRSLELAIKKIGNVPQRLFKWDLPIKYPAEAKSLETAKVE